MPCLLRSILGATAPGGAPCPTPSYQVSDESADAFVRDFRIKPSDLGISNSPMQMLNVGCETEGYSLISLGAGRALLIYQGHFFATIKQPAG
jgi:hypothetical protein